MTTLQINGQVRSTDAPDETPLLWVLRDELGMTGTKFGCGMALCGSCTVHVDGQPTRSCTLPIGTAKNHKITTIEGMSTGDALHPLQQAFIDHAALQCGICTPGILVAAKALLDRNPDPTDTELRYWLAGNLCRCTGYDKIIRAVQDAAAEMRGAA